MPQQVVVEQGEEAEVDVADAGPLEVVETVALVQREDVAQGADAVVGVRVLEQELDRDRERERLGDLLREPEESSGATPQVSSSAWWSGCFISPLRP